MQAMLTLKKRTNFAIGLGHLTGLILAFFIGNTSSLTYLGQEYKWYPTGNIMDNRQCGISSITKAVSWPSGKQASRPFNLGIKKGMLRKFSSVPVYVHRIQIARDSERILVSSEIQRQSRIFEHSNGEMG